MLGKNPMINGEKPNEVYDLDNKEHLKTLGYDLTDKGQIADEYAHYPRCDWAVIEWKGSAIARAAQTMMDGLRIYYNFIRPHTALDGKTPAQKANIETDKAQWRSLIRKASQHQRFNANS